ncbi:hypothetical protein ACTG1L_00745 [Aeromonas hydrophila]|uniref:DUF1281 family ferredoxin-like fold protein n=1 Tax=Aeromonas hydrophila TaxID=644 RepID=UPI0029DC7559|nr:hypothetical protein [Aeromonas hydrophila]MDX7778334.1 hypothetical protein [Aeromonas hydrophila]
MPNHVTNIIQAPRHVLESLINGEGKVDFNSVVGFQGKFEWNGIRLDAEQAAEVITKAPLSENPLIASLERHNRSDVNVLKMDDEGFEQFVQMLRNKRQHGFFHTMDFAREKWGTKWNAYSQKICLDDGFVQFDTAWACPVKLLEELSKQHPGINIIAKYADEDIGSNCGTLTFMDGNIVAQECAGRWSEMSELARAKWSEFACEVTGRSRDEDGEE